MKMQVYIDDLESKSPGSLALAALKRALENPTSAKLAIAARCAQCENGFDDTGYHDRVRACPITSCPLHPVRSPQPNQADDELPEDSEAEPREAEPDLGTGKSFDPVARAREKPASRRLAVRAYCWLCMGGGKNVNTQNMIRDCPTENCTLHHRRPYKRQIESNGM